MSTFRSLHTRKTKNRFRRIAEHTVNSNIPAGSYETFVKTNYVSAFFDTVTFRGVPFLRVRAYNSKEVDGLLTQHCVQVACLVTRLAVDRRGLDHRGGSLSCRSTASVLAFGACLVPLDASLLFQTL